MARAVTPAPDGGYPGGNTAEGDNALRVLSSGTFNTAVGLETLYRNAFGHWNTAIGTGTLHENVSDYNTAVGTNALWHNTTGDINTAIGVSAMYQNTAGFRNTAVGYEALLKQNMTTRDGYNTAIGAFALHENITGNGNTANGDSALWNNKGDSNTGMGAGALYSNTTGNNNTAIGSGALSNALGSLTTGSNNIGVGFNAGSRLTNGSNNINIGNVGVAGEAGKIRIGTAPNQTAAFIAGIYNVSEGGTIKPVYINSTGRLGTQPPASARKFKEGIKAMEKTSEAVLKLKPVSFRYKNDEERTPQFGLIAEEVASVNPDLVVRDEDGEIYTVRYEAVNAMLLNEFLKAHRLLEEQQITIERQQKQIDSLAAGLQKVNHQMELTKATAQTVAANE